MKREAKRLFNKAVDSLTLSIEHFNRPHEVGRVTATLLFLDHAMEMLLKASLVERGGNIDNKDRPGQKIGFDACVGRGLSDDRVRFLTEDQAKLLRMINGQRDAAQHYLVDISEELLYLHIQAGVSTFGNIMRGVFHIEISSKLPERVLPISTTAPTDLHTLFDREIDRVLPLLVPGSRKRIDAEARLRSLIIVDKALIGGNVQQPSLFDTRKRASGLINGKDWHDIFPGVASIQVDAEGTGHTINFVMSKHGDGLPVYVAGKAVNDGSNDDAVIVHRVNEFDRYSMTLYTLAEHLELNSFQAQAIVWHLGIKENDEAYKEFKRNSVIIRGYSPKALQLCRDELSKTPIEHISEKYKTYRRNRRRDKK